MWFEFEKKNITKSIVTNKYMQKNREKKLVYLLKTMVQIEVLNLYHGWLGTTLLVNFT